MFDTLMEALEPGGRLVFSFNDHALADPAHEAKVDSWVNGGRAKLLFKEYGEFYIEPTRGYDGACTTCI